MRQPIHSYIQSPQIGCNSLLHPISPPQELAHLVVSTTSLWRSTTYFQTKSWFRHQWQSSIHSLYCLQAINICSVGRTLCSFCPTSSFPLPCLCVWWCETLDKLHQNQTAVQPWVKLNTVCSVDRSINLFSNNVSACTLLCYCFNLECPPWQTCSKFSDTDRLPSIQSF